MSIIKRLAKKHIELSKEEGFSEGIKEAQRRRDESHSIQKQYFYEHGVFINIGNEWQKMDVVKILGFYIKSDDIPTVKSLVDDKEYITFATLIPYSEAMVKILKKLTPYERYDLVTKTKHCMSDTKNGKKILTKEEDSFHFNNEASEEELIKVGNDFLETIKKPSQ